MSRSVKIVSLSNHPNGDCLVEVSEDQYKYKQVFSGSFISCKKIYTAFVMVGYNPENLDNNIVVEAHSGFNKKIKQHSLIETTNAIVKLISDNPDNIYDIREAIANDDNEKLREIIFGRDKEDKSNTGVKTMTNEVDNE